MASISSRLRPFTGAAQLAPDLGDVFSVVPALAATLEVAVPTVFTILVWVPGLFPAHTGRPQWTAVTTSSMITAGAWG